MVCSLSCSIAAVFIIGMIYFYNATSKNATVLHYRAQLNDAQQVAYDAIRIERLHISIQGYILGFILSLIIIFVYN